MNFNAASNALLVLGATVAVTGVSYAAMHRAHPVTQPPMSSTDPVLYERQQAIDNAAKAGKTEYSYTTHYIPGVGLINDPEQYKAAYIKDALNAAK